MAPLKPDQSRSAVGSGRKEDWVGVRRGRTRMEVVVEASGEERVRTRERRDWRVWRAREGEKRRELEFKEREGAVKSRTELYISLVCQRS